MHDVDEAALRRRQLLLEDQRARWNRGERVRAEDYRARAPDLSSETVLDLVYQEVVLRQEHGEEVSAAELEQRFPDLAGQIGPLLEVHAALGRSTAGTSSGPASPVTLEAAPPPGYELMEPLGRGGMGVVYRARQTSLGRLVALKFLAGDAALHPDALARFQREARTVSALNHPHICTIHDLGQHDGRPFIAMELIAGRTLNALMRAGAPLDGTRIVAQVAAALAVAHDAGVVHRDVKPDNIMVRDDGYVKVVDFGLARLVGDQRAAREWSATAPGAILGTPRYMSPEQLRGEPAGEASDVFSLGIVWYELATGRHPFAAESLAAMLEAVLTRDPPAPEPLASPVPRETALLLRMLAKAPYDRPSMREVLAVLAPNSTTSDLTPRAASNRAHAEARPASARRRRALWLGGALLLVGIVAAAVVLGGDEPAAPGRVPSIAVLPFESLGESTASYFSEGVSEDITAMLARAPDLSVVAPSSVQVYRGRPLDVRAVREHLGVDYLLGGRVQKEADKVRIVVHLIDAVSGDDVWSERFDKTGVDPWQLQDEVAGRIVAALTGEYGQLKRMQYRDAWGADSTVLGEYDYYLRGHEIYVRYTPEANEQGAAIWRQGLEEYPHSSLLLAKLAWCHFLSPYYYYLGSDGDYGRARELVGQALAQQHVSPLARKVAHWLVAYLSAFDGDFDKALREVETTRALAPYDAFQNGDLASVLIMAGQHEKALAWIAEARRRDPVNLSFYRQLEGWALSAAGRWEASLTALSEANDLLAVPLLRAVALIRLGRTEEARRAVADALRRHPGMTLGRWRRANAYRDGAVLALQLDALAKAGLPPD